MVPGFAPIDSVTGDRVYDLYWNDAFKCENDAGNALAQNNTFCNKVSFSNDSWAGIGLPDIARKPIKKDTITIPPGGYVIIRFKADNPG